MTMHYCSICEKAEMCKEEDCDFIEMLGFHGSCKARKIR